ncbi:MAG: YicC/YloC family endoribonuclease [Pseudomonadota bacterium]
MSDDDRTGAPLSGMTGFARVSGEAAWGTWAWEAKSVNGRGLDVRVHTPSGFEALERLVKTTASQHFKRGSLQVGLRIEASAGEAGVAVNEGALEALVSAHRARSGGPLSAEALATLMTAKGVMEAGAASLRDLADNKEIIDTLSKGAEAVLSQLKASRDQEGATLGPLLTSVIDQMEAVEATAASVAQEQPTLLKARLETQLAELQAEGAVDADRLAAEVALSAAKADIREELDRLTAHFESGRRLLQDGSPAGRKLDFLAQELNREVNTLCSKSASLDLTNAGLSLKALIDQFKEQAANVE